MKTVAFAVVSLAAVAGVAVYIGPAYGQSINEAAPVFVNRVA